MILETESFLVQFNDLELDFKQLQVYWGKESRGSLSYILILYAVLLYSPSLE